MKKLVLLGIVGLLFGCATETTESSSKGYDLIGTWSNESGTVKYVFVDESEAMWLIQRPEGTDTILGKYRYESDSLPQQLDFYDLETNVLNGKDVYGIVEFASDTTLIFDSETGENPEEGLYRRPKAFNEFQTVTFYKQ